MPVTNGKTAENGRADAAKVDRARVAADEEKAAKARDAALKTALGQIEQQFGKGTVMRMGDEGAQVRVEAIPTGALTLDLALGYRGRASRAHRGGLRPRVLRQDDADLPRARGGAEARRRVRVHRRRARDGPDLREGDRRGHRRAPGLAAGLRRAGARDRRHAGALRRRRRRRDRLGCRAHAARRARGRNGRPDGGPAGAHDVAGDAQARRATCTGRARCASSRTRSAKRWA